MKKMMLKILAIAALSGSVSGCATLWADENCPVLKPVTIPVDVVTAPIQACYIINALSHCH